MGLTQSFQQSPLFFAITAIKLRSVLLLKGIAQSEICNAALLWLLNSPIWTEFPHITSNSTFQKADSSIPANFQIEWTSFFLLRRLESNKCYGVSTRSLDSPTLPLQAQGLELAVDHTLAFAGPVLPLRSLWTSIYWWTVSWQWNTQTSYGSPPAA